ncbi:MAG: allophanate hydrolase subunit 1 [Rhizobium sp.]|nr:allophanate hydrolase subunit 1 [Rhizobium sp.]
MAEPNSPVLSYEGPGALLLDGAAGAAFSDAVQARIWQLAEQIKHTAGVLETVPGMNNLMTVFDPVVLDGSVLERAVRQAWQAADGSALEGRIWDVPVFYGGENGPDLVDFAARKSMSVEEIIARHAAPLYSVAAVGAMPGFVYLSGLDPTLAMPRLSSPRNGVPVGSVIVGGAQAGIMPVTAPSGWHILGRTDLSLFDPHRARPAFFKPGDRIRFVAKAVS